MKIKKESDSARSELETVASIMLALVERIPEEQVSDKKLKELATALWARPKKVAELDQVDGSLYKTRATMFKKCLVAANSTMPETPPVVIQKVQTIILKPDKINCDKIAQKATGGKTIEIKKSGAIKVHDKEDTQEVLSFAESLLSEFAVLEGWKERVAEWTTYIKKRREVSPDNLKDDETPEEPIQESMRDTVAAGLLGLMGATGLLADTEYTVKPGDTLYAIAQKNDTSVRDLKKLNPGIDDINKINVGDKVKIPGEAEPIEDTKKNPEAIKKNPEAIKKNPEAIKKTFKAAPPPMLVNHKIVRGDSLSKIANIYGDSIKAIKERNGISDNDVRKLKIGDVLSVGKYVVDPGKELNLPVPKHLPDFIKKWEAYRNDAYLCPAGEWTIGYGRTRNKDGSLVKPGDKAHGRSLEHKYLMDELERLNRIVNRYLKTELNPNQLAALLSFGYNTGGYSMVPIIKDQINLGDMKDAIDRMGTYINVKDEETGEKKEEKGLINRRAEERKLWDGKYDKKSENRLNKHKPDTFAEHLLEFYI